MKTKAAILVNQKCPLEIVDLTIPKLREGQVLVKVEYSGICRTQINEIMGLKGKDPFLPHTLGHEGSGIVVDIGPKVSKVKIDQKVVISWLKGRGIDSGGTQYFLNEKAVNSGPVSTFLEYAVISENRLYPLSQDVHLREAALLGCAIPTGAGLVFNDLKVAKGKSLCIYGFGGIGISALLAAKYQQLDPIIVVDVCSEKIRKAIEMGASHGILVGSDNVSERICEITDGKKADYALESAGKKEAMEMAFSNIHDNTGVCVLSGNLPKGQNISIDPFDLIKGKRIYGSWGGGSCLERDMDKYLELIKKERDNVQKMITYENDLENVNGIIEYIESGQNIGRALIKINRN